LIIPRFWAEGHIKHRHEARQVTVRRFGWSDASQAQAQEHADQRTREALGKIIAGVGLVRRELKVPYNGADGLPIREEIISQQGETIVTRNAYGALCLNTPHVFFADIDFDGESPVWLTLAIFSVLSLCGAVAGWFSGAKSVFFILLVVAALVASALARWIYQKVQGVSGGVQARARQRIDRFIAENPGWNFRIYQTPAGLRVMATHQTFSADDPAVARCFAALQADPIYALMCLRQQCFRARVSAKPWRIGMDSHLKPRPGVWPVSPEHLPARTAWIAHYDEKAQPFAACRFWAAVGSGVVDAAVAPVQQWHDELSKASLPLPIA
jgi:hypothetical protein